MLPTTYRIVLCGIEEGAARELTVQRLATVFGATEASIQRLADSGKHVVKTGVDLQTAAKYETAIAECGWVVAIEPEVPSPDMSLDIEGLPASAAAPRTASTTAFDNPPAPAKPSPKSTANGLTIFWRTSPWYHKALLVVIGLGIFVWMAPKTAQDIASNTASSPLRSAPPVNATAPVAAKSAEVISKITESAPGAPETFSEAFALRTLYGQYDSLHKGAEWTISNAPKEFANWNGRKVFVRQLLLQPFKDGGVDKKLLVTASADLDDREPVKPGEGCHACPSVLGAAIFRLDGATWKVDAENKIVSIDGSWGGPPDVKVYTPPSGAFEIRVNGGYTAQGETESWTYSITHANGKWNVSNRRPVK